MRWEAESLRALSEITPLSWRNPGHQEPLCERVAEPVCASIGYSGKLEKALQSTLPIAEATFPSVTLHKLSREPLLACFQPHASEWLGTYSQA